MPSSRTVTETSPPPFEAGATLASVNRTLAQHRQWIPLDPPWADAATIGGLVATNDSGPRRHRYGAPRDLIIGVEFARADGSLAKGGGIVVKNVAGYDLPSLLTGSFGCLGVIVTATFKLYPLTAASRRSSSTCATRRTSGCLRARSSASHLTPTALEFNTHPLRLIIRFESIEASVEQQSETAADADRHGGLAAQTLQRTRGRATLAGSGTPHGRRRWRAGEGERAANAVGRDIECHRAARGKRQLFRCRQGRRWRVSSSASKVTRLRRHVSSAAFATRCPSGWGVRWS